jgi:hypothetical protein
MMMDKTQELAVILLIIRRRIKAESENNKLDRTVDDLLTVACRMVLDLDNDIVDFIKEQGEECKRRAARNENAGAYSVNSAQRYVDAAYRDGIDEAIKYIVKNFKD